MDFEKGVPFDPGFSAHTFVFSQNIESVADIMASLKAPHQKKFQYKVFAPKIKNLFGNSTAFYLGCLLWASFINKNFEESPKEILNNSFLGKKVNEDVFFEIDYMLNYIKIYEKDCKYFLGKVQQLPQSWIEILEVYKEFLELNNNFTSAQTTDDIKLPSRLKTPSKEELSKIHETIEEAVSSGSLEKLFEVKELIL